MDIVETVARAIAAANGEDLSDTNMAVMFRRDARAAIEALRGTTLVYRDGGEVVHELRGAPDDIWKTLLDAALTPPLPLEGV